MKNLLKELNQIQSGADLQRELSKLMAVLRALKSGEIKVDNVIIDGDNWKIEEIAEPPPVVPSEPVATAQVANETPPEVQA